MEQLDDKRDNLDFTPSECFDQLGHVDSLNSPETEIYLSHKC